MKKSPWLPGITVIATAFLVAFLILRAYPTMTSRPQKTAADSANRLLVTSPAFDDGALIPPHYTCDGARISPALLVTGIPAEAKMLALIVDDPDAPGGTWIHWVLFNIPIGGTSLSIPSGVTGIGLDGSNSWGRFGYRGPCPPSGVHHYHFKIYALDSTLPLPVGSDAKTVDAGAAGRVVASGELVGLYSRKR